MIGRGGGLGRARGPDQRRLGPELAPQQRAQREIGLPRAGGDAVEQQRAGVLHQRPRQTELAALRRVQRRAAFADALVESGAQDGGAQVDLLDQRVDPGLEGAPAVAAVDADRAEEHVLRDRERGHVFLGIEEDDARIAGQRRAELRAGLDQFRLAPLAAQHAEAEAGRAVVHRDGEHADLLAPVQAAGTALARAAHDDLDRRRLGPREHAVALEEIAFRPDALEQRDQRLADVDAEDDEHVVHAGVGERAAHVAVGDEIGPAPLRIRRQAEEQVLPHRAVRVEGVLLPDVDEVLAHLAQFPGGGDPFAQLEQAARQLGLLRGVEAAAEPDGVEVLLEAEGGGELQHPRLDRVMVGMAGLLGVDPVVVDVVMRGAGEVGLPLALARRGVVGLGHRPELDALQQIAAQRSGEGARIGRHVDRGAVEDRHSGAPVLLQPVGEAGERLRQRRALGRVVAEDRRLGPLGGMTGDRAGEFGHARAPELDRVGPDGRGLAQGRGLSVLVEVLHHRGEARGAVREVLVEAQQLLPRRGEILVGDEHGGEGADVEIALDHEPAADQEDEERRDVVRDVVHELDEELQDEDPAADHVVVVELAADDGHVPAPRPERAHLDRAVDALVDLARHGPDVDQAQADHRHHLGLQLGDQPGLQRVERERGDADIGVLGDDEAEIDEEAAARHHGRDHDGADEVAELFQFGRDHLHDLAGAGVAQAPEGAAHHPAEQVEAHPAQHPFAEDAALHVLDVLDGVVDRYRGEIGEAEREQILRLLQLVAEDRAREAGAADGVVDDGLRQLQRYPDDRKAHQRGGEQQHLVASGMTPDIGRQLLGHGSAEPLPRPLRRDFATVPEVGGFG